MTIQVDGNVVSVTVRPKVQNVRVYRGPPGPPGADGSGTTNIQTNSGATGEVTYDLSDTEDWVADFRVTVAQFLKAKAPAGTTIRVASAVSADGGYVRSNVVGDSWRVERLAAGEFWVTSYNGSGLSVDE